MFSYLLIFLSSIILLCPIFEEIKTENKYSLIFVSLTFSHFLLGSISLFLVLLNLSKFPVLIISFFVFVIFALDIYLFNKKKLNNIKNLFITEKIKNILLKKEILPFNKYLFLFIILLGLIFLSSIGPINHSDASDYHLGYPYQYFLRGGFFVDGGLHQGLLGIGDYANLSFIQEKTIWLVRPMQVFSLPLLVIYLNKINTNKLFLLIVLTCPLLISWSTIGKPLFLSESCLTCLYLQWKDKRNFINYKYLIISLIACISTKSSSLLICFPIMIHMILDLIFDDEKKYSKKIFLKSLILDKLILFSIFSFFILLYSRFLITDNFAYPFFTKIFNSENIQINNFALYLKNYGRDIFFPINIFIPLNLPSLSMVLGFPFTLTIIYLFIQKIRFKRTIFENSTTNILFAQLFLLIFFCQGRGYYYLSPLILIVSQSEWFSLKLLNKNFKSIFYFSITFQFLIFLSYLLLSIYQNLNAIFDYDNSMQKTAFGYSTSKLLEQPHKGNTVFLDRNTRLFYNTKYIDQHLLVKCISENSNNDLKNAEKECLVKFNIDRVISSEENFNLIKENLSCYDFPSFYATRNPFNRKKINTKICDLIN